MESRAQAQFKSVLEYFQLCNFPQEQEGFSSLLIDSIWNVCPTRGGQCLIFAIQLEQTWGEFTLQFLLPVVTLMLVLYKGR